MVGISGIMLRDRFSCMILCLYSIRVVCCTIFYYYVIIYIITNYTVYHKERGTFTDKNVG